MSTVNGLDFPVMSGFAVTSPQTPLTSTGVMDASCNVNMGFQFHNIKFVSIHDVIMFYCRYCCLF